MHQLNIKILRQVGYKAYQGWGLWLQFIALLAIGLLFIQLPPDNLAISIMKNWESFIMMGIYLSYMIFHSTYSNKTQIEIDEFGIDFKSGLPDLLQRFNPGWRVSWGEIQSVTSRNQDSYHRALVPLKIKTWDNEYTLNSMQWIDPKEQGKTKHKVYMSQQDLVDKYENSTLIQTFIKRGLLKDRTKINRHIQSKWSDRAGWSDLTKSPTALLIVGIFAASIFYYFIDTFGFQTEVYTSNPPYLYIFLASIMALILTFLILLMTKLMMVERIILAIFIAVSTSLLMYPLLPRVNHWTDTEGLQTYPYKALTHLSWTPVDKTKDLPTIRFSSKNWKFWHTYELGSQQNFELRKGKLGFYQINMKPIHEKRLAFYRSTVN